MRKIPRSSTASKASNAAQTGEPIYLGLSVSMLDQKEAIPFLTPDRERLLEYDISRAISRVMTPDKAGRRSDEPAAGRRSADESDDDAAWASADSSRGCSCSELQRDFTVKQVEMTADKIPDDIKVLVVIHPKGITDAAQYAIDQFVLRGGKLIAFVDPLCVLDQHRRSDGHGRSRAARPSKSCSKRGA